MEKQPFFTVTKEEQEGRHALLTVEFDESQIQERVNQTAKQIGRKARIPGYRPGRAPARAILRYIGENSVREELAEQLVKEIYPDVLKQGDVEPSAMGKVVALELKPMKIIFKVPLAPVVKLDDGYKSVHIEKEEVEVSDEMIDDALEDLREKSAQWVPQEESGAEPGDRVTINLKVSADGEELLNQEEFEFVLEPGELFLQEFVDQLVGMKVGESKEFQLEYPDDAKVPWAGKKATFVVELLSVKKKELPELDDEFAKEVGEFESLDDLKQKLRDSFEAELESQREDKFIDEAMKALLEHVEVEYPEELLEEEMDVLLNRRKEEIKRAGWDWNAFLRISGQDEASYRESLREDAERFLKERLALKELAKREGIEISDEELDQRIEELVESSSDPKEARRLYKQDEIREMVREDMLVGKALERWLKMVAGEPEEEKPEAKEGPAEESGEKSEEEPEEEPESTEAEEK